MARDPDAQPEGGAVEEGGVAVAATTAHSFVEMCQEHTGDGNRTAWKWVKVVCVFSLENAALMRTNLSKALTLPLPAAAHVWK